MSDRDGSLPENHGAAEGVGKERLFNVFIFLLGLVLAISSEPLAHRISSWVDPSKVRPGFQELMAAVGYGLEHLGVVLVVAIIVRVGIERASQRQFLHVVNNKVREQIGRSIQQIAKESLTPLQESMKKLDQELDKVRQQIGHSIEQIAEQSLAPLQKSMKKLDDEMGFAIRRPGLLDKDSLEVLTNKVLSPKIICTEYDLQLTLEPFLERPGFMKIRSRSTCKVRNITTQPEKYLIEAWVDSMFEPVNAGPLNSSQFTRFACGPEELRSESDLRPFDLVKMAKEGMIKRDHGAVWLGHELPGGIPAETTYYVDIEAEQLVRLTDTFLWSMSRLTQRFTVSVEFKGGFTAADFQLDARELHHIGHEAFRRTFKDEKGVLSWRIDQVLLPHQGVVIWWSRPQQAEGVEPDATPRITGA